MSDIRKLAINNLAEVKSVLMLLTQDQYIQQLAILSGNSVGKHIRHILEFYQAVNVGFSSGIIDYDQRQRNIVLECNLSFAIETIVRISEQITLIENSPIQLNSEYDDHLYQIQTNIFREIAYNIEHSIHHLAIIKIGINLNFSDVILPSNLGIAKSTTKHLNQQQTN